jgi:hypothetical protein
MECKGVKTTEGYIPCIGIHPISYLPGFFELWVNKDERRIINGIFIIEVYESMNGAPDRDRCIATVINLG